MGIAPSIGGRNSSSREAIRQKATGIITEWANPASLAGSLAAPSTGVIFGAMMGLQNGDTVTGVLLRNNAAASGTSPTLARVGIADSSGKILAVSATSIAASANWPTGAVTLPFSAPYTALGDGGYYACFIVVGTWGTTQPALASGAAAPLTLTAIAGSSPPYFQWTGQSDLPAVGSSLTLTTGPSKAAYMAFY